ncbi:MAG: hypothetical protein ACTSRZ_02475 [Promethearchaeota archaeon]
MTPIRDSYNERISSLIDLFKSINIVEKGIEKVYDYLLQNEFVDDIKSLAANLGLNIKRVYKIFSVLKDLGLVQIYSRPMTVHLLDPQSSWEKIIQERINEIKLKAEEMIQFCNNSFEKMKEAYQIKEIQEQPIEFISLIGDIDLENAIISLLSENISLIAHGIWYDFDFRRIFEKIKKMDEEERQSFKELFEKLQRNIFKVLISEEYHEQLINKYKMYFDYIPLLEDLGINNLRFEIRITKDQFSNFVVKDNKELIQPSFDPSDLLIGYFVSNPGEITNVFEKKFNKFFEKARIFDEKKHLEEDKKSLYRFLLAF